MIPSPELSTPAPPAKRPNLFAWLRNRPPQWYRFLTQAAYLLFFCWLAWRFFIWVTAVQSTGIAPFPRPAAVDGFLPISGLAGLRYFSGTGQLHPVHPAAALILLAALLSGLLLKRGFCSWICPVFSFSEQLWRLGARLFGRTFAPPFWLDLLLRSLKYLILLFFVWQIGVLMALPDLENFLFAPYHQTADISMLRFFLSPGGALLIFLSIFVLLALFVQNPWCRYLCPYGALLGLASLFSLSRIHRDVHLCIRCGACSARCPAWLPVMLKGTVRSAECFACYRCVQGCPAPGALQMRLVRRWCLGAPLFALLLIALFVAASLYGRNVGRWEGFSAVSAVQALRPHL